MSARSDRRSAFTLIELLVVIAIIGLLVAMTMTAVRTAMEHSKRTKARSMVSGLKAGLQLYYDTYDDWPLSLGGYTAEGARYGVIEEDLARILNGANVEDDNLQQVTFVGLVERNIKGETVPASSGDTPVIGLLDPWGRAYRFGLDLNDDGDVSIRTGGTTVVCPGCSVVVWSLGPDKRDEDAATALDNLRTW